MYGSLVSTFLHRSHVENTAPDFILRIICTFWLGIQSLINSYHTVIGKICSAKVSHDLVIKFLLWLKSCLGPMVERAGAHYFPLFHQFISIEYPTIQHIASISIYYHYLTITIIIGTFTIILLPFYKVYFRPSSFCHYCHPQSYHCTRRCTCSHHRHYHHCRLFNTASWQSFITIFCSISIFKHMNRGYLPHIQGRGPQGRGGRTQGGRSGGCSPVFGRGGVVYPFVHKRNMVL